MKDEYEFSGANRGKFFRQGARLIPPTRAEPTTGPHVDVEAWFARLDELGGRDFLPDGIPEDPPAEPDTRVFLDENRSAGEPNDDKS